VGTHKKSDDALRARVQELEKERDVLQEEIAKLRLQKPPINTSTPEHQYTKMPNQALVSSLKDELQAERKDKNALMTKLEFLSGRMRDLESDVLIRDKAL
jgi:chromosome segregation ATPase